MDNSELDLIHHNVREINLKLNMLLLLQVVYGLNVCLSTQLATEACTDGAKKCDYEASKSDMCPRTTSSICIEIEIVASKCWILI